MPDSHPLDLTVVVPAYRAERTIRESLARLLQALKTLNVDYEVIVVVDGEVDGTAAAVAELNSSQVRVIAYHSNRGKGYALRRGFAQAAGAVVGFIDADLDLHPDALCNGYRLLMEQPGVGVVVASKSHPESTVDYPPLRRMQSRAFALLVRTLFGLPVRDTQTGLKLFRREAMDAVLQHCECDGFAIDLELLSLCHRRGYVMSEIPVELDFQFESTVRLSSAVKVLKDAIAVWVAHRHDNPSTW